MCPPSVKVSHLMLQAIAGFDPLDPTSSRLPAQDFPAACGESIAGTRIGVDDTYITEGVHPEVSAAVKVSLGVLEQRGARIVPIRVPEPPPLDAAQAWMVLTGAEALAAHAEFYPARAGEYGPFRELLDFASGKRAEEYARAHAMQRLKDSREFKEAMDAYRTSAR